MGLFFQMIRRQLELWVWHIFIAAQKMKFSITDFFSKCDQIRRNLQIWLHLLKKSLIENIIFCAVHAMSTVHFWVMIMNLFWIMNTKHFQLMAMEHLWVINMIWFGLMRMGNFGVMCLGHFGVISMRNIGVTSVRHF